MLVESFLDNTQCTLEFPISYSHSDRHPGRVPGGSADLRLTQEGLLPLPSPRHESDHPWISGPPNHYLNQNHLTGVLKNRRNYRQQQSNEA